MIFTSGNETFFFSVVFAVNCSKSPGWSGVCACKSSADVCVHVPPTCGCRAAPEPAEPAAPGGKPGWCNIESAGEESASLVPALLIGRCRSLNPRVVAEITDRWDQEKKIQVKENCSLSQEGKWKKKYLMVHVHVIKTVLMHIIIIISTTTEL